MDFLNFQIWNLYGHALPSQQRVTKQTARFATTPCTILICLICLLRVVQCFYHCSFCAASWISACRFLPTHFFLATFVTFDFLFGNAFLRFRVLPVRLVLSRKKDSGKAKTFGPP